MKLIKNAQAVVKVHGLENLKPTLDLTVFDVLSGQSFNKKFDQAHPMSKMALETDIATLQKLFNGGHYFIVNDRIADFKLSNYEGFIHNDEAIAQLSEKIGVEEIQTRKGAYSNPINGLFVKSRQNDQGFFMGGVYDHFDMQVKELKEGGDFNVSLVNKWSPFSQNITNSFEVQRLVCANGMVANSPFVVYQVPCINAWEENLKVISNQLKYTFNEVMNKRFNQMSQERASVADLIKATGSINQLQKSLTEEEENSELGKKIARIKTIITPENVSGFYGKDIMSNKQAQEQASAHITQYDLYNVLTEASTHYANSDDSRHNMNVLANKIVFDDFKKEKKVYTHNQKLSQESDHKRAFFGE